MPSIEISMRRSLNDASTWDIISDGLKRSLTQRNTIGEASDTVTDVKTAFSSWDNCMSVTWCKWPVIAVIAVVSLIVIGVLWCMIRCLCCGLSCCCECCYCLKCCGSCCGCCEAPRNKRKHRYLDDPYIPPNHSENMGYQMQPQMKAPGATFNMTPASSVHPASGPPQYAEFDVSHKGGEDALPAMPSWDGGVTKKVSLDIDDSVEMNNLAKTATSPSVADVAAPVAAADTAGAVGAFAARQNNAAFRGAPSPLNSSSSSSSYGPARPQDPPYGHSMTPGAMSQGRSTPGKMNQAGRITPGFANQAAGRSTPGFGNQQGGAMGGAYGQKSHDPYGQDPYGQQNSAYATPVDHGYNNNVGYQNAQNTGYTQKATYGQNLDTGNGYDNGYGVNGALPSPQESAFHYDNPAYHQTTQPQQTQQSYGAYAQQDQGYGNQNTRNMTGGYAQQQSYNTMTNQTAVNNPYAGQNEVYEMPSADYSGTGNSIAMQNLAQTTGVQQSQYAAYSPTGASNIQNTGGFDFNSGFSRPGSSGPQDVQRMGTPQGGANTTYAAPKPYRPNPEWTHL